MDDQTKRLLMEQIDKSLLEHTAAAGKKENGPEILDAYLLMGLTETHYYLKAEHDFKPNEAAALLQFSDPLVVVRECWEERDPDKGFPICALLNEIKAYERFPLVDSAGRAQRQKQMVAVLKAVLDQNMAEFHTSLLGMDKEEIIARSAEIAAMREAYDFMQEDFKFEPGDAEILLRMENPLKFIANQWPSDIAGLFDMNEQVGEAIWEAGKEAAPQRREEQTIPAEEQAAVRPGKPSILSDLSDKKREAGQRSAAEGKSKGGEAR